MSSRNTNVLISVPTSYIKAPGSIFERHSAISAPKQLSLSSLIDEFKLKTQPKSNSLSEIEQTPKKYHPQSLGSALQRYSTFSAGMEPGRMKNSSDDLSILIQLSNKILSFYEIDLAV